MSTFFKNNSLQSDTVKSSLTKISPFAHSLIPAPFGSSCHLFWEWLLISLLETFGFWIYLKMLHFPCCLCLHIVNYHLSPTRSLGINGGLAKAFSRPRGPADLRSVCLAVLFLFFQVSSHQTHSGISIDLGHLDWFPTSIGYSIAAKHLYSWSFI